MWLKTSTLLVECTWVHFSGKNGDIFFEYVMPKNPFSTLPSVQRKEMGVSAIFQVVFWRLARFLSGQMGRKSFILFLFSVGKYVEKASLCAFSQ